VTTILPVSFLPVPTINHDKNEIYVKPAREGENKHIPELRTIGPIFPSLASMGLRYEASSPIIRAKLSSTLLSASERLKKSDRH
jgi:hypothetical protein